MLKNFLIFLLLLGGAAQSAIKKVGILPNGANAQFVLIMDQPLALKTSRESDEVFVIEGFEKKEWGTEEKGMGSGPIKEYYIEDYSNGSAELVINTNPGMKLESAKLTPKGDQYHYEVQLASEGGTLSAAPSKGMLEVSKVQIGKKGNATRLVFHLNRAANFNVTTNPSGTQTMIIPDERPKWEAQTTMNQGQGLFKGYELIDRGAQVGVKIQTLPGTKVGTAHIQDANSENPKYVVDLVPDTISTVSQKVLFDPTRQPTGLAMLNGLPKPIPGWNVGGSTPAEKPAMDTGMIRSMDILTQSDDTIIKFVTTEPIDLDVTENEYTNQVIVHLPKVSWMNVDALDKSGGLISSYNVDQSSGDGTNLILNVQKGTHVIGKKTVSGGGNQVHRFLIYLNQNENKTPEWLVDAATEKLAYQEEDREEIETTQVVYRGGITPKASVAQGPYAGWNATYFTAEDKIQSTNTAGDKRNLFTGVPGVGVEGYIGFGTQLPSDLYVGGELMVGHLLGKQTRTYDNPDQKSSEIKLGFTWGGSLRLGGYVAPMALLYSRVGIVSTDFWFKGSQGAAGDVVFPGGYNRRNRTGFLYGVGLDAALNDYTSFRFEVDQVTYQPFTYSSKAGSVKHRFILNQFSVGTTHHFQVMSGPSAVPIYEESVAHGLYVGGAFALNNVYTRRKFKTNNGGKDRSYYGASSNSDPVWGFYAGYGKAKERFYYAGEIDVALTESVTKQKLTESGGDFEVYQDALKWRWGVSGRLGYIMNHGVIGYGKLGVAAGKFTRSSGSTTKPPHKFSVDRKFAKTILGMRVGGGLEVAINRALGIRGEWTMDYYPKVNIKGGKDGKAKETEAILDNRFGFGLTIYLHDAMAKLGLGSIL